MCGAERLPAAAPSGSSTSKLSSVYLRAGGSHKLSAQAAVGAVRENSLGTLAKQRKKGLKN